MVTESKVQQTATEQLAKWIEEFDYDRLPEPVIERTKQVLYDGIGCAIAATSSRYDIGGVLADFVKRMDAGPKSQIFGMPLRTNTVTAALVNGTLSYYIDNESHHSGAIMHAIAVVGPAALAVGEEMKATGKQVLTALVLGIDVACRMSYALDGTVLYARGFHPTCVAGAFGAMAATAKLMNLQGERLLSAMGLCGTQASGLLAWVDDRHEHARPFNMGLAARNGTYASELARSGLYGAPAILDSKYPLGAAFTGAWNSDVLLADLNERFYVMELVFKLYACCAFIHPGLDALLDLQAANKLKASDIESMTLHFPKSGYKVIDGNPLLSHSAQYVLALAASRGAVEFDDILNDRRSDPEIKRLEKSVTVVGDSDLDREYPDLYHSILKVETVDHRHYQGDVVHPKGSPENPVSDKELRDKFSRLTTGLLPVSRLRDISDRIYGLELVKDVGELSQLLRGN